MKAKEAMFAWNPKSSDVEVGIWPDKTGWSKKFKCSGGACEKKYNDLESDNETTGLLFIDAIHLIIGDEVEPKSVHREFCKIEEYCNGLAEDMPRF